LFKKYLSNEIRSISLGCIPSIRTIQRPGRLSIGQGGDDSGTVSPEEIPARPSSEDPELMSDLVELLRKQSTPDLHLVDLFHSLLAKEGPEVQSRRFGMSNVAKGRRMIVGIIQQYAQKSQNWHLMRLLDRFRERFPNRFAEPQRSRRRATGAGAT
jgi:hypothetical protein